MGQVFGLRSLSGVAALIPSTTGELLRALDPKLLDPDDPRVVGSLQDPAALDHPILRLTATRFVLAGSLQAAALLDQHPSYEQVYADAEREWMAVYRYVRALPQAFPVAQVRVVADPAERLALLSDAAFDPERTALVEHALAEPVEGRAELRSFDRPSPEAIRLQVRATRPSFVVVSEAYDPGWSATLNGDEALLHRTDHALMGVAVPVGEHELELSYAPTSFLLGAATSAASLLILCILPLADLRRRRKGPDG
jgi:hypothetical protein